MAVNMKRKRRGPGRQKISAKYQLPKDVQIDYKNIALLQKFVNDRGKITPRRLSGLNAKQQRQLTESVKIARYLGLLVTGSARR